MYLVDNPDVIPHDLLYPSLVEFLLSVKIGKAHDPKKISCIIQVEFLSPH
jgi:hypothetical protein